MNRRYFATNLAEKENLSWSEAKAAIKLILRLFSEAMNKRDRHWFRM